jgi:hypothetical protein
MAERNIHAQHLLKMAQKYYKCLFKAEGVRYCGLIIKWDYAGRKVHLLMPEYVTNALKHFQHPPITGKTGPTTPPHCKVV